MAIIKCPLGVHYAEILPAWRFQFLVCRNMLSPAGKLSLLANIFVRVQRATKGRPVSTRLDLRTLVAWLVSTCKGAVPTAFLRGPFFPGVGATLDNYVPDRTLFAFGNCKKGFGVRAEDVIIFFGHLFKLPKQNTQPLEELGGVGGNLPRR